MLENTPSRELFGGLQIMTNVLTVRVKMVASAPMDTTNLFAHVEKLIPVIRVKSVRYLPRSGVIEIHLCATMDSFT